MVFSEINWRLDFISESLDFNLVPVKNHRLLRSVCLYAKHSSLFDLQSDLLSVFTAEITKVHSRIEFCAAGDSLRPIDKREKIIAIPQVVGLHHRCPWAA
jgi:hypothetical protein